MSHSADKFIGHLDGPLAIARWCRICQHSDTVRKPRQGDRGRGWGMREGNKQRGRLIQHVKEAHPEKLYCSPSGSDALPARRAAANTRRP